MLGKGWVCQNNTGTNSKRLLQPKLGHMNNLINAYTLYYNPENKRNILAFMLIEKKIVQ